MRSLPHPLLANVNDMSIKEMRMQAQKFKLNKLIQLAYGKLLHSNRYYCGFACGCPGFKSRSNLWGTFLESPETFSVHFRVSQFLLYLKNGEDLSRQTLLVSLKTC